MAGSRKKGARRSAEREAFWRRHVEAHGRSGARVRTYCAQHGLTESAFHYWKRELRRRDGEAATVDSRRGDEAGARVESRGPVFAEVAVTAPGLACSAASPSGVEVCVGDGRVVRVARDFDASTLQRVVAALENTAC